MATKPRQRKKANVAKQKRGNVRTGRLADRSLLVHIRLRFLEPGVQPHPPHTHADEELMIVTRGQGEIYVGDKTTPVRRGAVMYTDPNVSHGIKNTGANPLEFYWIKYVPRDK